MRVSPEPLAGGQVIVVVVALIGVLSTSIRKSRMVCTQAAWARGVRAAKTRRRRVG